MNTGAWPHRWDLLTRYRLIEIVALWEGRLTTNHLGHAFGIGRQQASKDINTYNREIAPGNLLYDPHLKGYRPAPGFVPQVTAGEADEYLQLLNRHRDLALRFDPATRQVHWRDRAVELTGRELALLEALLKHPQRVLSKAQLQERLYDWGGGEPESNALEVHVHHLRRKIDPSIVRTVRGVGYALGAAEADS